MARNLSKLLLLTLLVGCEPRPSSPEQEPKGKDSQHSPNDEEEPDQKDGTPSDEPSPGPSEQPESKEESPSKEGEGSSTGGSSSSGGDDSSSTSTDSSQESGEPSEDSSDTSKSDGSGSSGEDPGGDPCDKIEWGDRVKVGSVVPRGDAPGFWDEDGDGTLDDAETQVGMCELHKTGKKCAIVIYGKEN